MAKRNQILTKELSIVMEEQDNVKSDKSEQDEKAGDNDNQPNKEESAEAKKMESPSNGTDNPGFQDDVAAGSKTETGDDGGVKQTEPANNNVKFDEKMSHFEYERRTSGDSEKPPVRLSLTPPFFFNYNRRRSSLGPEIRAFKMNIWKNLLVASLGMMGIMSAYDMLRYVESSLNQTIGTSSLAANYATLIICVLFLATLLLRRIGCKWTIVIAMTCFILFFAAHFFPDFFPGMVIGGMFIGVGIGLVQTATNTYITMLAISYGKYFKESVQEVLNRFFGVFHFIVFMARIWGNLTSSLLLTPSVSQNVTLDTTYCGRTYKPEEHKAAIPATVNTTATSSCSWHVVQVENQDGVAEHSTNHTPTLDPDTANSPEAYALYGTAMAAALLSALLMGFFLDDKRDEEEEVVPDTGKRVFERAIATLRLLKEPRMFLLIPLTICFGVVEAYMSSDFTQGFVTCTIGIHNVGYVIICYGMAASLFSYLWGWLANRIGRITVIMTGTVIDIGAVFAMLYWHPSPEEATILYVLAALWGIADAVWRTQIYAFYGFLFSDKKEAGFSNLEVWMAVGLVVGYTWHKFLNISEKLIIILVLLISGVIGYLSIEFILWANKKKVRRMSTVSQLS